jgi:hypothetical protein
VKFGCSGRLRSYLNAPPDVQRVPTSGKKRSRYFDMSPTTIYKTLSESTANQSSHPDVIKRRDEVVKRFRSEHGDKTSVKVNCINHAECVLLSYHIRTRDTVQPFNYFGCSKLGCLACRLYFTAYNEAAQQFHFPTYHVRWSHGKLYPRWAAPNLQDVSPGLQRMVVEKLGPSLRDELADHMESLRLRALSDSSAGSRVDAKLRQDADELEAIAGTVHLPKLWWRFLAYGFHNI